MSVPRMAWRAALRGALCALALGIVLAVQPVRANAPPLPPEILQRYPELRPLGAGEMRWFGLRLYEARLWVSGDRFDPEAPFALLLTYHRAIPAGRLVDSSISEMRQLGTGDEALLAHWRAELERAFPSVSSGESIVGVHHPGAGAEFWHQGRRTASIADARFARAFFAIWLDARTREPGLRAQLVGGQAP
jgi:hypothetical protein